MFDFLNEKDRQPPALPEGTVRRRYSIEGQVQGVGFRYRARYAAQSLGLTGWVENEDDGSVTLEVQGDPDKFMSLFAMIQKSDYIQITGIRQKDIPMVMGATLFLAVLFSFVILLVDVLYAFIDPRIKAKYQNGGKSRG